MRTDMVLLVAMANNRVIGRENGLPWKLRSDLQRFKQLTMGNTLIMGRKTWESIGRLLPGRTTIVISRSLQAWPEGPQIATSLEAALEQTATQHIPFIVGGAEIYRLALPYCRQLWLTRVDAEIAGDTHFPAWEGPEWSCYEQAEFPVAAGDEFASRFEKWRR